MADGNHTAQHDAHDDQSGEVDDEIDVSSVPPTNVVLGIDIGGTKFAAGLITARGELVARARVEVERDVGPESHWTALAGLVAEMQLQA